MLTENGDHGDLTPLGRFCSSLPVDAILSRMIAMGIALGVQEEAIILAAALSQQRTLFQIASPFIHKDPDEMNSIIVKVVRGAEYLDNGCYSEPIMYLRAFLIHESLPQKARDSWLYQNGLVAARFKSFRSTVFTLISKVQNVLDKSERKTREPFLRSTSDDVGKHVLLGLKVRSVDDRKLNILRLLLLWSSVDNICEIKKGGATTELDVDTEHLTEDHLRQLMPSQVDWKLSAPVQSAVMYSAASSIHNTSIYKILSSLIEAVPLELLSVTCISVFHEEEDCMWILAVSGSGEDFSDRGFILDDDAQIRREGIGFDIFALKAPSEQETYIYKNPQKCEHACALNLLLHGGGKKKKKVSLLSVGVNISYSSLENIFFGQITYGNGSGIDTRNLSSGKRVLSFQSEDTEDISETYLAKARLHSTHSCLINDMPLGMRLLSAISNVYHDKKIVFWLNPACADSCKSTIAAAPVGSKEWKQEREKMADRDLVDDSKFTFKPKNLLPSWRLLFSRDGSCQMRHPITSMARPKDSLPFYAVAYSSVEFHTRVGVINQLEGVTCLPMGTRWLRIALNCIGITETQLPHSDSLSSLNRSIGEHEAKMTSFVSDLLYSRSVQKVERNEELIHVVTQLFSDWERCIVPEGEIVDEGEDDIIVLRANAESSDLHEPKETLRAYASNNEQNQATNEASSLYSGIVRAMISHTDSDTSLMPVNYSVTSKSKSGKKKKKSLVPAVLVVSTGKEDGVPKSDGGKTQALLSILRRDDAQISTVGGGGANYL